MKPNPSKLILSLAFVAAAGLAGCAGAKRSGEDSHTPGAAPTSRTGSAHHIEVTPMTSVNPVGTQHVLVATVFDEKGNPVTGERVEWMLARGGVGELVEIDQSDAHRVCTKVDNYYAITHTHAGDRVLDMGTATKDDDILIRSGQTWAVITSPVEGTSHIIAYAPGVPDWNKHKVFATKHWRDVKVTMPAHATNRIGTPHEMTVRVARNSDGTPLPNHIVNFRIVDGPAAALTPGNEQAISVRSDAQGMATATLELKGEPQGNGPFVNTVEIQVIRPENEKCCEPAVLLATAIHKKTWVRPNIGIRKGVDEPDKNQAMKVRGEEFNWHITVFNPSPFEATDVVVTDSLPEGIAFVSSVPQAKADGQGLTWDLGTVPAEGTRSITVRARATKIGHFENCATVTAEDGRLKASDCAAIDVKAPAITITKTGPAEVILCEPITYKIVVTNTGDAPAMDVKVTDQFPDGLATADGRKTVSFDVGLLEPKQMREMTVTVNAAKVGEYENCATVSATGLEPEKACATTKVVKPELVVTKTGPTTPRLLTGSATFKIEVKNTGNGPARNTMLRDQLPAGTTFQRATEGGTHAAGVVTWNLGTIAKGQSKTVEITIVASAAREYLNTATVTAFCAEGSGSAKVSFEGNPAVVLEMVDNPGDIQIDGRTTYTIIVKNQGTAPVEDIVIRAEIPESMRFVSSAGTTGRDSFTGADSAGLGGVINFKSLRSLAFSPTARDENTWPFATWTVTVEAKKVPGGGTRGQAFFVVHLDAKHLEGQEVTESEPTTVTE